MALILFSFRTFHAMRRNVPALGYHQLARVRFEHATLRVRVSGLYCSTPKYWTRGGLIAVKQVSHIR